MVRSMQTADRWRWIRPKRCKGAARAQGHYEQGTEADQRKRKPSPSAEATARTSVGSTPQDASPLLGRRRGTASCYRAFSLNPAYPALEARSRPS